MRLEHGDTLFVDKKKRTDVCNIEVNGQTLIMFFTSLVLGLRVSRYCTDELSRANRL